MSPWAPVRPCRVVGCAKLQPCATHPAPGRWDGRGSSASRGYGAAWQRVRREVLIRDGYRCRTCGALAEQVDHVRPRAEGGSDDPSNLAAICRTCHASKSGGEGQRRRGAG